VHLGVDDGIGRPLQRHGAASAPEEDDDGWRWARPRLASAGLWVKSKWARRSPRLGDLLPHFYFFSSKTFSNFCFKSKPLCMDLQFVKLLKDFPIILTKAQIVFISNF
jgi:hypothetical protein